MPEIHHLVRPEFGVGFVRTLAHLGEVRHRQIAIAPHGNSLELLGAHHRPDPRAPGVTAPLAGHAGKVDQVLAGNADRSHPHIMIADRLTNPPLRLQITFAGQLRARHHRNPVVVDKQIAQFLSGSGNRQGIIAGLPQLDAETAAHTRIAEYSRRRRNGREGILTRTGQVHPCQRARRHHQQILRSQRINRAVLLQIVPQQLDGETAPAHIVLDEPVIQLLGRAAAVRHIHL